MADTHAPVYTGSPNSYDVSTPTAAVHSPIYTPRTSFSASTDAMPTPTMTDSHSPVYARRTSFSAPADALDDSRDSVYSFSTSNSIPIVTDFVHSPRYTRRPSASSGDALPSSVEDSHSPIFSTRAGFPSSADALIMDDAQSPVYTDNPRFPPVSTGAIPEVHDVPDPVPQYQGDDIWLHWQVVDKANTAVTESQAMLADLEAELKEKNDKAAKLKEKSSKLFETLHHKSRIRLPPSLKRITSSSSSSAADQKAFLRQEFEEAHKEETAWMLLTEELTAKVDSLKENIERHTALASTVDEVFELLGASAAATLPDDETHGPADEQLALASTTLEEMQKLVADIVRARVTVQHAHHYYTIVLKTIDSVRGTPLGRLAVGGLGEVSKQQDYKVALETAYKAQVCFNETVRVLTPHLDLLPPRILEDFEGLKERGLLQASKIYGMMYGWKSKTSGISKGVQLLLQRQEEAFARLTHLAVWVQDETPSCEAKLREARAARDKVRRDMVRHWNRRRCEILDIHYEP